MTNLRKKARIDTQYLVSAILGQQGHTKKQIKAMILNISMDGALIETAENLKYRSLILVNTHDNHSVSIHAKIVHRQDVPQEERVFGPYKTGLHFLNNTAGAREFIISIIKAQEADSPKELMPPSPDWVDTENINVALISTDYYEETVDLVDALAELPDILETLEEPDKTTPDPDADKKPQAPKLSEARGRTSFKEAVEQALYKRSERDLPAHPPNSIIPTLITLAAFMVLLSSLFIFRTPVNDDSASLTSRLGIELPFFGERPIVPKPEMPEPVFESPVPAARLVQNTILSSMIYNKNLGPLFIIRGYIKLEAGHRPEEVTIRGKLINGQKEVVGSMSIWPGNTIDDRALAGFNQNELLKVSEYTPETGYRSKTPFIMVFSDVPADTRSFSLDLTFQEF